MVVTWTRLVIIVTCIAIGNNKNNSQHVFKIKICTSIYLTAWSKKCVFKYCKTATWKASYKFNLSHLAQGRKPPVGIGKLRIFKSTTKWLEFCCFLHQTFVCVCVCVCPWGVPVEKVSYSGFDPFIACVVWAPNVVAWFWLTVVMSRWWFHSHLNKKHHDTFIWNNFF